MRRDSTVAILASSMGTAILETQYVNKCTLFITLYLIYKSCSQQTIILKVAVYFPVLSVESRAYLLRNVRHAISAVDKELRHRRKIIYELLAVLRSILKS